MMFYLGYFNCRGDYILPNGHKVKAENLGIEPFYKEPAIINKNLSKIIQKTKIVMGAEAWDS